jgi:hypothetical protein
MMVPVPRSGGPDAVELAGVESPSRRNRSVSRRQQRMGRCLVGRLRVLGCSVSASAVCRKMNPDGRPVEIVTAESCMSCMVRVGRGTVARIDDGAEASSQHHRQEVGVRPFRLLNNTVPAP